MRNDLERILGLFSAVAMLGQRPIVLELAYPLFELFLFLAVLSKQVGEDLPEPLVVDFIEVPRVLLEGPPQGLAIGLPYQPEIVADVVELLEVHGAGLMFDVVEGGVLGGSIALPAIHIKDLLEPAGVARSSGGYDRRVKVHAR